MTALLSCLWSVPTTTSPLVVTHEPTTWARSSKTEWKNEKIYPEKILKKIDKIGGNDLPMNFHEAK